MRTQAITSQNGYIPTMRSTIGLATYRGFGGVYFTLQSLRAHRRGREKQPFREILKEPVRQGILGIWYADNTAPTTLLSASLRSPSITLTGERIVSSGLKRYKPWQHRDAEFAEEGPPNSMRTSRPGSARQSRIRAISTNTWRL